MCKPYWLKDVKLVANVKIVDWPPQNDLVGKDFLPLQAAAPLSLLFL